MKDHVCKEATHCMCSLLADEPDEDCPMHGFPYPPRCAECGRFLKRKEYTYDIQAGQTQGRENQQVS